MFKDGERVRSMSPTVLKRRRHISLFKGSLSGRSSDNLCILHMLLAIPVDWSADEVSLLNCITKVDPRLPCSTKGQMVGAV
jgi:hypothetical protein